MDALNRRTSSEGVTISLYEHAVPAFVEPELERLYASVYSSLAHLRLCGALGKNTSTYIARENGRTISVLLFNRDKHKVQVLNETTRIDAEEIGRFSHYLLAALPSVDIISFHAIRTEPRGFAFPYQQFNASEDIIVILPRTASEYLGNLGKATRKKVKQHMSRFKRSFPSSDFAVYLGTGASEQHVRQIIELNRARMAGKKKVSIIDEGETQRIIALVKQYGLVSVVTIDSQVCAGAICCRIGANYYSLMIAHDPEYDGYRLGTLCCYQTICECIERGGKEFHFLWGRDDYKYMLSGVQQNLDDLVIYRSHVRLLLHCDVALRTAFNGNVRKLKVWMQDIARQKEGNLASRLALHFFNGLRRLKQLGSGGLRINKHSVE